MSVMGPFDSERQARAHPAVRAIYGAFARSPRPGGMDEGNRAMLSQALASAGVSLGSFDQRIAGWLAGWEPHVAAVVTGWVSRAHHAGLDQAPAALAAPFTLEEGQAGTLLAALTDAAQARRERAAVSCHDCAVHPADLCEDHATDLDRAAEYDTLATSLGAQLTAPSDHGHEQGPAPVPPGPPEESRDFPPELTYRVGEARTSRDRGQRALWPGGEPASVRHAHDRRAPAHGADSDPGPPAPPRPPEAAL